MTNVESDSDGVFDLDRIRDLVQLMIDHGLSEVDLRQHGQTVRLRRGEDIQSTANQQASPRALSRDLSVDAALPSTENEEDADHVLIKSPMVGTFYCRPNPDAESFVQLGQEVTAETVVCIVEAMKVFNEIPAEVAGKIVAVLVENEEPVEFGKPLFKVRKLT